MQRKNRNLGSAAFVFGAAAGAAAMFVLARAATLDAAMAAEAAPQRAVTDWIFNLPDEEARTAALQLQLRGLDVAMWEIGERYKGLHEAIGRNNSQLAVYHWDKIKQSLDNALVRRPARRANSEALFLNEVWPETREVLAAGDTAASWAALERVRTACMACHEAENLAYMNNMAMFDLRAPGG
jgi:hypothetical protein